MGKQKYPSTKSVSADGTAVRKGREHYSHEKADARIKKRQDEADNRQFKYDGLTVDQKLALAKSRRGESKREVTRLLAAVAKGKKA